MATIDTTVQMPRLADPDDPCEGCGAALAEDQRYCLNCGARRAGPRVAFSEVLGREEATVAPAATAVAAMEPAPVARDWTPMIALGALGGLALVLIVGVLIGKTGFGDTEQAAAPQVITVGGAGGGAAVPGTALASTASAGSFKSDWPSGKEGYTVELGVLPKSSDAAAVQQAKSDATGKGAPDVGALDSDEYKSLPGGKYVVYSGVFDTKAKAAAALKKLGSKFPDAQVVQVADTAPKEKAEDFAGKESAKLDKQQLEELDNLSGDEYAKRSRKLPTTTALPGKPPPTDNKAPGGGSGGGDVIK